MDERVTIPNLLTLARIAMALGAGGLAAGGSDAAAVAVLIAAALLDAFDGWYARSFAQCSGLGKHLDPFADKVLIGVVYAWIGADAGSSWVWWLVGVAFLREAAVTALRSHHRRRHGRLMPASALGRWKMFLQSSTGLAILSVAHFLDREVPVPVVVVILLAVLVVSYASAIGYLVRWKQVRAASAPSPIHTTRSSIERVASGG